MIDTDTARKPLPVWLWVFGAFGIAWNVFGLVQLWNFVLQTRASLMMKGMSPAAADIYYTLPVWMKAAFAVGSLGGLLGSAALIARRRIAIAILLGSLLGYIGLYWGDYVYGVFAVIPGQMAVLSVVLVIAIVLLCVALIAKRFQLLE